MVSGCGFQASSVSRHPSGLNGSRPTLNSWTSVTDAAERTSVRTKDRAIEPKPVPDTSHCLDLVSTGIPRNMGSVDVVRVLECTWGMGTCSKGVGHKHRPSGAGRADGADGAVAVERCVSFLRSNLPLLPGTMYTLQPRKRKWTHPVCNDHKMKH